MKLPVWTIRSGCHSTVCSFASSPTLPLYAPMLSLYAPSSASTGKWTHHMSRYLPFRKGSNGADVPFHNSIIGNFIVYQDRIHTDLLKLCAHAENSEWFSVIFVIMVFCNFCYYFWGQNCCWTEKSITGNDFFVFHKFPLRSTILLPPCPTVTPASLVSYIWTLDCWCQEKNINLICPDYKKCMTLFKKSRDWQDETLNSQDIPANSSSGLHHKVIFEFIIYYYEPSPNKLKGTPNAVDQAMDLLLSRPTNTGENHLIINLKPQISANTTYTSKKTKICTKRLFSPQIFLIYTEWFNQ